MSEQSHNCSPDELYAPITPENRDEMFTEIFSRHGLGDGKWFGAYLDGKIELESLTPKQQEFARAYDGLMVGFFDFTLPRHDGILRSNIFPDISYDNKVSISEVDRIIKNRNHFDGSFNDNMSNMGEQMSDAWKDIAGGVLAGIVDSEGGEIRYDLQEFTGIYSPRATDSLRKINDITIASQIITGMSDPIESAIDSMNNICSAYAPDKDKTEQCLIS